jgi:hypothetical protein
MHKRGYAGERRQGSSTKVCERCAGDELLAIAELMLRDMDYGFR